MLDSKVPNMPAQSQAVPPPPALFLLVEGSWLSATCLACYQKGREQLLWALHSSVHPHGLGVTSCLLSRANMGLRLQTGLPGGNRLPLWGHPIPKL